MGNENIDEELIKRFAALFAGYTKSYGRCQVAAKEGNGKVEAVSKTWSGPVTLELWQSHFAGNGPGIGILPLRDDGETCSFAAIDIDNYDGTLDHGQWERKIQAANLPFVICRSKSGGAHLYVFFSNPVPATVVQKYLTAWTAALGLPSSTEQFPKRTERTGADIGNWINVPYQNETRTMRYAFKDGEPILDLAEFLDYAESRKVSADQLPTIPLPQNNRNGNGKTHFPILPAVGEFEGAPPCLVTIRSQGGFAEGTRNNGMLAVGVYLKKRFADEWQERFEEYNQLMCSSEPLPRDEIQGLVKSLNKKGYRYSCKQPPIRDVCQSDVCVRREFGIPGDDVEEHSEFTKQWIWCTGLKSFIKVDRPDLQWDKDQFNDHFAHLFNPKLSPAKTLLSTHSLVKVELPTFWPGQEIIVSEGGKQKFNLWRPSGVLPEPGDVSPFLKHVRYLVPDEREAEIVLDYLAYMVKYPGSKIRWALLIQGLPGIGKSYLAAVMKSILGDNVKPVTNDDLHSQFTSWQKDAQLIFVEEVMIKGDNPKGRMELMNKLKTPITEDWCIIHEKFKPPYRQPNRFNFLLFTNHEDAIVIDGDDRRYCIIQSPATPQIKERYYADLFAWTKDNGASLLAYLLARPLTEFSPNGHAPLTQGRQTFIENSKSPLEEWIADGIESAAFPFKTDLVSIEHLKSQERPVAPKEYCRLLAYKWANALKLAGAKPLVDKKGVAIRYDLTNSTGRVRLWAIRNQDVWLASADDRERILREYESFMSHNFGRYDPETDTALSAQMAPLKQGEF